MITKQQKAEFVQELISKFRRQKIAVFTDFHGVSVTKLQKLRRQLKKNEAEYKVARKTLIDRAVEETRIPIKAKELHGEIGITFGYNNEIGLIKILVKFRKENETFKILGGIFGEKKLTEKDIIMFSKLPSREVLLAQIVGALQEPIRKLVVVLNGNLKNLVVIINKIKDSK